MSDVDAAAPVELRRSARSTGLTVAGVRRLEWVGIVVMAAYLVLFMELVSRTSFDIWGGVLYASILGPMAGMILVRRLRAAGEPTVIVQLFVLGLVLKISGAFARYATTALVFGVGDADSYHSIGVELSREFRRLEVGGAAWERFIPDLSGTPVLRLITGIIYTFSGPTKLGGFVIFALLSFCGLYFFYRAFRIALPNGDRSRYAVLLLFLPSMLFWPSSIGKDAWMGFCLGLGAYGAARLYSSRRGGYVLLAVGMFGTAIVRPHVTFIFFAALGAGALLRRRTTASSGATFRRIALLIIITVAGGLILSAVQSFFGLEDGLSTSAVDDVLNETTRRSAQGGSAFEPVRPTSPSQIPWAVVTVLFRPFPFEANNFGSVIAAAEGTMLLVVALFSIQRFLVLPTRLVREAYLSFVVAYSLVFTFAFSAVANFGILARQRTQLLPVFIVLLAVPVRSASQARAARLASGRPRFAVSRAVDDARGEM